MSASFSGQAVEKSQRLGATDLASIKQEFTRMLMSDPLIELYGGSMETFKMSTYVWCSGKFIIDRMQKQLATLLRMYYQQHRNDAIETDDALVVDWNEQIMTDFDRHRLTLWFDNRCKGRRHPAGAHFFCAKYHIPRDTVLIKERPVASIAYGPQDFDNICGGCFKLIQSSHSSLPCGGCDEVAYCNLECKNKASAGHKFECGLAGFVSGQLSPIGLLLWRLYGRAQCPPDYSKRLDLIARPSLSTDSDLHPSARVIKSKSQLPKRSYQYRYILLANAQNRKESLTHSSNGLIGRELVLALREAIDHKEEALVAKLPKSQLIDIVFQALLMTSALQFVVAVEAGGNHLAAQRAEHDEKEKWKLCFLSIVEDMVRFYRFDACQAFEDNRQENSSQMQYYHLPVLGNVFWRSCKANLAVTFNRTTGWLEYRTTTDVDKFDKLTLPVQDEQGDCHCFRCGQQQDSHQATMLSHSQTKPKHVPVLSFRELLNF